MTTLAATATTVTGHLGAWLCLFALAAVAVVFYLGSCWVWPYANCRRCHGIGRFHSHSGRAWRPCHRCKGTGARLRTGRRVINHFRRLHAEANR